MPACERYLNAINELVDGTLGPIRRAELALHLESCEECAALVGDLREIARAAGSLDDLQPPDRVWRQLASQLQTEGRVRPPRRALLSRPSYTVLALAAALVLVVGASVMLLIPRQGQAPAAPQQTAAATPVPEPPGNASGDVLVQADTAGLVKRLEVTEQSFKDLLAEAEKSSVPPTTVAALQGQFLIVSDAMEETRKALEVDPQDAAARNSFYEMLRQKIRFLQDTIALMNEMRQGDAAGAAEIVEGGKS